MQAPLLRVLAPLCAIAVALTFAGSSQARVWRVAADGSGEVPTVQAGLDSARSGDVVLLAPGTYTWTAQGATGGSMLRAGSGVTLRSEAGAAATILDAEGRGRILGALDAGALVVLGLTFRNGFAPEVRADSLARDAIGAGPNDSRGGAIAVASTAHLTLRGCVFRSNRAGNGLAQGGAVYCGAATIEDCEFADNSAGEGGHTDGRGGAVYCGAASLVRCRFTGNRARGYESARGGAVHSSSARVTDCVFEDNSTACPGAPAGGALSDNGEAAIERCSFRRNRAEAHYIHASGGALSLQFGEVRDCLFLENIATGGRDFGRGGGLIGSVLQITGCVFLANEAYGDNPLGPGYGGAVYLRFASTLDRSTFVGNSGGTPDGTGTLVLEEGGEIRRCILARTSRGRTCTGAATWSCTNLFANIAGDEICGSDAAGNFVADPLFCATDPVAASDVTLQSDSPCAARGGCERIGAGDVACKPQAVERSTWSAVKRRYAGASN